jgi:general stress protein 26
MSEKPMTHAESVAKVAELLKDVRICMLTTENSEGRLHSRPMATQDADFDGDIWFLTRDDSGKVSEIRHASEVNLSYSNPKTAKYVSISGVAELSKDRTMIKQLWSPLYKAWFPDGEDDPRITVLRVRAKEAEYWEASSSALVRGAKYVLAAVTRGGVQVGENKKVTLEE